MLKSRGEKESSGLFSSMFDLRHLQDQEDGSSSGGIFHKPIFSFLSGGGERALESRLATSHKTVLRPRDVKMRSNRMKSQNLIMGDNYHSIS